MNKISEINLRKFTGTVVSTKMDKTAVVEVDRQVAHPKYKKTHTVTKKFKCHDEKNQAKVGQVVEFVECRPLSKDKRWRIIFKKETK